MSSKIGLAVQFVLGLTAMGQILARYIKTHIKGSNAGLVCNALHKDSYQWVKSRLDLEFAMQTGFISKDTLSHFSLKNGAHCCLLKHTFCFGTRTK